MSSEGGNRGSEGSGGENAPHTRSFWPSSSHTSHSESSAHHPQPHTSSHTPTQQQAYTHTAPSHAPRTTSPSHTLFSSSTPLPTSATTHNTSATNVHNNTSNLSSTTPSHTTHAKPFPTPHTPAMVPKEGDRDAAGRSSVDPKTKHRMRSAGANLDILSPATKKQLEAVRVRPSLGLTSLPAPSANHPNYPDWTLTRPYLTHAHLYTTLAKGEAPPRRPHTASLKAHPLPLQEQIVLEDVISVLMGIPGHYITASLSSDDGDVVWQVDSSLDLSLSDLVQRVLPMACQYLRLCRFVAIRTNFHFGLVNHALCAAFRSMMKEYLILIAQLEHQFLLGRLTLQKLWFYIQPSLATMELLDRLVRSLNSNPSLKGGALLNIIQQHAVSVGGDDRVKQMFAYLQEEASVPILAMVTTWIYKGQVDDPYGEFMVDKREGLEKETLSQYFDEQYWEKRYTLRPQQVPYFLAKASQRILTTGKYLNAVTQCGRTVSCPFEEPLAYTPVERSYDAKIERVYLFASQKLLDLMLNEKRLVDRLKSLKHYFFMDQGDVMVHFMDLAHQELAKPVADISQSRLESLLDLSLRTASTNADPFKDDLSCCLLQHTLVNQLLSIISMDGARPTQADPPVQSTIGAQKVTGWETFTFDYKAAFPLSLVLSRKAITKYQILFRFLLHCKYVERQLCQTWQNQQATKAFDQRVAFSLSYTLRQRMLHFLQNLQYYMAFEVVDKNWHRMMERFAAVETVDDVLEHHMEFLDTCLKECMLTDPHLLKTLTKLMSTCIIFSNHSERFTKTLLLDHGPSDQPLDTPAAVLREHNRARMKVAAEHVRKIVSDTSYQKTIRTFEENFDNSLRSLMATLHSSGDPHLGSLCARLDFNGFYASQFRSE